MGNEEMIILKTNVMRVFLNHLIIREQRFNCFLKNTVVFQRCVFQVGNLK